jgi:hypothetical protein
MPLAYSKNHHPHRHYSSLKGNPDGQEEWSDVSA